MTYEDIVMTPVTEILRTVTDSVDFSNISTYPGDTEDDQRTAFWFDVITEKCRDEGFGHLVESILERGWSSESAIGWDDGVITEGHHRLVAAILLGIDEVPTCEWGQSTRTFRVSAHYPEGDKEDYPIFIDFG